jgi:ADP-heptose:LPS heptosyltransferase
VAGDGAPIAVLQTQRMGDLILTYPLLLWLARHYSGQPLTVVAEPDFAGPLAPISPPAAYVPLARAGSLLGRRHALVLNLSIRPEAAKLAGELTADTRLGPVTDSGGITRVYGDWQLYRSSLVGNNRHNRFHWAELNALDAVPLSVLAATRWPEPRGGRPGRVKVGLFLGASQPEKRPSEVFFAELARECIRRGLTPVLLGGPGEVELGAAVVRLARAPMANLCGRLGLQAFSLLGQEMTLCVTSDTGPMHLAAWTGWRVLNLSVGPVNPLETGPYQPGHYVLRPRMSCRGCWQCVRPDVVCRQSLDPARVAYVVARLARGEEARLAGVRLPGVELWRTDRDVHGLYRLIPLDPAGVPDAREALGEFWKATFGWLLRTLPEAGPARTAFVRLAGDHPRLADAVSQGLAGLGAALGRVVREAEIPEASFCWRFPPHVRPLAGFFERVLQNGDGSRAARLRCLSLLAQVASLASGA